MDIHEILKISGGALALLLFIPMARQILKENGAGQSFATWILWAAMDSILAASTIIRHGNYYLPLGFAIGGVAMTILLLAKKRYAWGKLDTVILILVVVCIAVWEISGARAAIAAGLAQGMALRDATLRARDFVRAAIAAAPGFGNGHGPLNHAVDFRC